jgi:hypothetical protein
MLFRTMLLIWGLCGLGLRAHASEGDSVGVVSRGGVRFILYEASAGETMQDLEARFNVPSVVIEADNPAGSMVQLQDGQQVYIRTEYLHEVMPDDTIVKIAVGYHSNVASIKNANGILTDEELRRKKRIVIPIFHQPSHVHQGHEDKMEESAPVGRAIPEAVSREVVDTRSREWQGVASGETAGTIPAGTGSTPVGTGTASTGTPAAAAPVRGVLLQALLAPATLLPASQHPVAVFDGVPVGTKIVLYNAATGFSMAVRVVGSSLGQNQPSEILLSQKAMDMLQLAGQSQPQVYWVQE